MLSLFLLVRNTKIMIFGFTFGAGIINFTLFFKMALRET